MQAAMSFRAGGFRPVVFCLFPFKWGRHRAAVGESSPEVPHARFDSPFKGANVVRKLANLLRKFPTRSSIMSV